MHDTYGGAAASETLIGGYTCTIGGCSTPQKQPRENTAQQSLPQQHRGLASVHSRRSSITRTTDFWLARQCIHINSPFYAHTIICIHTTWICIHTVHILMHTPNHHCTHTHMHTHPYAYTSHMHTYPYEYTPLCLHIILYVHASHDPILTFPYLRSH